MKHGAALAVTLGAVAAVLLVRPKAGGGMASRINYAPGIVARTADEADAFYRDVYAGLGLTATPELMRFAQAWRLSEAGKAAWNPFNTTWSRGKQSDYNTVGVGNYPDRAAGLAATVGTLRLRYYRDLRDRMARGSLAVDIASSPDLRTWGTRDLVRRVLLANPGAIPYRSPLYGA